MIVSGLIILAFVPLHLITFKYGPYYARAEPGVRDLYRLLIEVFQSALDVAFYVITMILIGHAPAPWRVEQPAVAGADSGALDPGVPAAGHRASRSVVGAGFVLIPIYIYFRQGPDSDDA